MMRRAILLSLLAAMLAAPVTAFVTPSLPLKASRANVRQCSVHAAARGIASDTSDLAGKGSARSPTISSRNAFYLTAYSTATPRTTAVAASSAAFSSTSTARPDSMANPVAQFASHTVLLPGLMLFGLVAKVTALMGTLVVLLMGGSVSLGVYLFRLLLSLSASATRKVLTRQDGNA
jgi:hypothetical protein